MWHLLASKRKASDDVRRTTAPDDPAQALPECRFARERRVSASLRALSSWTTRRSLTRCGLEPALHSETQRNRECSAGSTGAVASNLDDDVGRSTSPPSVALPVQRGGTPHRP